MSIQPFFIGTGEDQRFAIMAKPNSEPVAQIVFVPPFCEEMNRCRNLVAEQMRMLSAKGYTCLHMDLFGTGDSGGELKDATWDMWLKDIEQAVGFLQNQSDAPIILLGIRLGALLAADFAARKPDGIKTLAFFQPVITGKTFMTQVYRQRVAFRMANQLSAETTDEIRQQLSAGNPVEVAGYVYGRELTDAIDELNMADISVSEKIPLFWLENVAEEGKDIAIGSQKQVQRFADQGNQVKVVTFTGPALWQLNDRADIKPAVTVLNALDDPQL